MRALSYVNKHGGKRVILLFTLCCFLEFLPALAIKMYLPEDCWTLKRSQNVISYTLLEAVVRSDRVLNLFYFIKMSDEREVFLTLASIFGYLGANAESRCITEGEQLLNANHIILIGTTSKNEEYVKILALCLQTSAIKSNPHEINGKFIFKENNILGISEFTCTCKAGLSGTCKHISAVLLKCTRSSVTTLEKLSSTDVKCYWTHTKKTVQEQYEAMPLLETLCYKDKVKNKDGLCQEDENHCFNTLIAACPDSSLVCHLKGRHEIASFQTMTEEMSMEITSVIENAVNSDFLASLEMDVESFNLKVCCKKVLKEMILDVSTFEEAIRSKQHSDIWKRERQFRITGSRCYSLYTFSKENWDTMANKFFWPKGFKSKYTDHGIKYEKEALEIYSKNNNYNIIEMGLVICQKFPWLAYSPDGVVLVNGAPERLVEIKCPYDGIENSSINFIRTCSYLEVTVEQGISLKKNHSYYGQVQLGMAILNLQVCDLILYSSSSKNFLNILVPFDKEFATKMLDTITCKYFNNLLHFVCTNPI